MLSLDRLNSLARLHAPRRRALLSLAGLAVICTAGGFLIFFSLIAEVGPARASVITYINPAVAVALGAGVLGERITPVMLAAFGTILAGSVLATRPGGGGAAAGAKGGVAVPAQPVAERVPALGREATDTAC